MMLQRGRLLQLSRTATGALYTVTVSYT